MITDRRQCPRFNTNNLISYVCLESNGNEVGQGMGKGINVSSSGILIETHNPIKSQDISLMVSCEEDEIIHIKGKVIYCRTEDSVMFRTVIKFLETNERIRFFVKNMITVDRADSESLTLKN
jgi:hypothetical protein